MGIGPSGGASHGPGAPPGPAGAASIGGRGMQGIQSGTGQGNVSPHGYAPTSKGSTAPKGPQGHAQINKYAVLAHAEDALDAKSLTKALNDPKGYFTAETPFGETAASQVEVAQKSGVVPGTLSINGKFGATFGNVSGKDPVTGKDTIFGDPEGGLAAVFNLGLMAVPGIAGAVFSAVKGAGDADKGFNTGIMSSVLGQVLGPKSPFSRSTTTPTRSTTTPTTSPTTSPKSSTTPVSVPRPKAKPQPLPKPPRQVGHGPNILEEEKKKGGRIKRKKNYSKGGGVRTANY